MPISKLLLILFVVILLSVGQILFKLVSNDIVFSFDGLLASLLNFKLIVAFTIYFVATILWVMALKGVPLRTAYPFTALVFFVVPTLSHFLLGETLGWNTYVGACIIGFGVIVSQY